MTKQDYLNLTDEELLEHKKKLKTSKIIHALLLGSFVGVMAYSAAKSGFSIGTFLPIVLIYWVLKSAKKNTYLQEVLKERNL